MRVLITTGGTRGDVQPYIALGKGLRERGIDVRVATAPRFEGLVQAAGLEFYPVSIDLQQLLDAVLEKNLKNPVAVAREFRKHVDPLLQTNVEEFSDAAKDADVLFYTPATFIGRHVATYLGIRSVSAEMQPAMRMTGDFRSSIVPSFPRIGNDRLRAIANRLSYVVAHESYWHMFKSKINETLTRSLGLPPVSSLTSYREDEIGADGKVEPILCGWSPQVLPKPRAWGEEVTVTGYWFLDQAQTYQPPRELLDFMEDGTRPVSIGFGSTSKLDPEATARAITGALRRTGNRAVLLTGWSELAGADFPEEVFTLKEAPHDWLYPKVSAAVHHTGSATLGASLRAGIPTVPTPFWFDQYFWGERVAELGVGPEPIDASKHLSADRLAEALHVATTDEKVAERARTMGEAISREDGVSRAIEALERHGTLK